MDKIDQKILESLQTNAREKNSILARKLNMPPTTLTERIKKLEERGVIKGYRAVIDQKKLGLGVKAFIGVSLRRHESSHIRDFEKGVKKISGIRACYHMSGRFDYMLQVAAQNLEQLGDLVKTDVTALPDFGKCETFLIFSEIQPEAGWPPVADNKRQPE
ncbi:MAG: Lrp/AsnC family transcriptional regulator [Desulfobacterales bacterium]|nr:Lrp/AsnC family transcriptional regulator [Desulfobacterales bacterium]